MARRLALCAVVVASLGCGEARSSSLADDPGGTSGGTPGAAGTSGAGGVSPCEFPSEVATPEDPGVHVRIDGKMNHFTRNLEAGVGAIFPPNEAVGFYTLGWGEVGVCGYMNFTLIVYPGDEELAVGTYECDPTDPHQAPGTYMVSLGGGYASMSFYDGSCTIELTEVGSGVGAEVAGTFSAVLGHEGGAVSLTEGMFRVTLTE